MGLLDHVPDTDATAQQFTIYNMIYTFNLSLIQKYILHSFSISTYSEYGNPDMCIIFLYSHDVQFDVIITSINIFVLSLSSLSAGYRSARSAFRI